MRIQISSTVFELFPHYVRYVLHVTRAKNGNDSEILEAMLQRAQNAVREDASFDDLKTHPRIASWREAFQKFGVNPNQCPPSVANLIKRVRGGKDLPSINALVDIFNIVSLRYTLPAGGDDLAKVTGGICLGVAEGTEIYTPLGQPDKTENPKAGEIILYDTGNSAVFCRAWCWKNGDSSRIEECTRDAAVNIDALYPVTAEQGLRAAEDAAALIREFCEAKVTIYRLDADSRQVEL